MIGAAAAAANLLLEFNIPENREDKLTKNKNGKVILVKLIASSIFCKSSLKPGAINDTKKGINISIKRTVKNRPTISKLKILFAKLLALFFVLDNSDE